jgi:hypothetical protein
MDGAVAVSLMILYDRPDAAKEAACGGINGSAVCACMWSVSSCDRGVMSTH